MRAAARKAQLIEEESALNQVEASKILGCQPREVDKHITPSFYRGTKPRYIIREVLKVRDSWVNATNKIRNRNRRILQNASA